MKPRQQPENLRLRSIAPSITASDFDKSLAWYRDILGCVVGETMEHEGKVVGAILRAGAIEIYLNQDDFAKGRDRVKGVGFRLYATTAQDIDAVASAIESRGGVLLEKPTDRPWGTRDFAVVDPDGFVISVSSPQPVEG